METVRFLLTAIFMTAGLISCIIGVIGVFRFRYAANRMHAAAINDTLGIALCMIGLAISAPDWASALKLLLVVVFFWISAPVASHLLCRLEVETNEEREKYMTCHSYTGPEANAEPAEEAAVSETPETSENDETVSETPETAGPEDTETVSEIAETAEPEDTEEGKA